MAILFRESKCIAVICRISNVKRSKQNRSVWWPNFWKDENMSKQGVLAGCCRVSKAEARLLTRAALKWLCLQRNSLEFSHYFHSSIFLLIFIHFSYRQLSDSLNRIVCPNRQCFKNDSMTAGAQATTTVNCTFFHKNSRRFFLRCFRPPVIRGMDGRDARYRERERGKKRDEDPRESL